MRPVKRALKMLENPEENTSEKDQVTQTKQVKKRFPFYVYCLNARFPPFSRVRGSFPEQWLVIKPNPIFLAGKKRYHIIKGFKQ